MDFIRWIVSRLVQTFFPFDVYQCEFLSISGSLSAWFRLKYPHLVYGAISASSPMTALTDFRGRFVFL